MSRELFKNAINEFGENVTFTKLNGITGSTIVKVIISLADGGFPRQMLDDIENLGLARPALKVFIPYDRNVKTGDEFTREGETMVVAKVYAQKLNNEIYLKVAIAS